MPLDIQPPIRVSEGHQVDTDPNTCDICGGQSFDLLYFREDFSIPAQEHFRIFKCKSCGLVFVHPQPSDDNLTFHYSSTYYSYRPFETLGRRDRFAALVRSGEDGYALRLKNPRRAVAIVSNRLFSRIVTMVPFIRQGRILDVGCGSGSFLYEMKQLGLEPYGIDINREAIAHAKSKGLHAHLGDLASCKFPDKFFDIITLRSVIEHVRNPRATLCEIYRVMKDEGLLILNTPNIASYEARLFGVYWSALDTPRHLFLFSLGTLQRVLHDCGFSVSHVDWLAFTPDQFLNSMRNARKFGKISSTRTLELSLRWTAIQPLLCLASASRASSFGSILTLYAKKNANRG